MFATLQKSDNKQQRVVRSLLVIDDHPLFCDALAVTLQSAFALRAVRRVHSLAQGIEVMGDGFEPDAILLDLNLPDASGVEGLIKLRNATPSTPIVVISAFSSDQVITGVMSAGAAGFIRKDAARDTLVKALCKIWAGDVYTPESYTPPKPEDESPAAVDDIAERLSSLTPQQMRILELVCDGKLNKQIAFELSIAETTVKAHVTAILRKLGVQRRTQAMLVASKAQFSSLM